MGLAELLKLRNYNNSGFIIVEKQPDIIINTNNL